MYSDVISLNCGISLNVLIALVKMSLFNNDTCLLIFFFLNMQVFASGDIPCDEMTV